MITVRQILKVKGSQVWSIPPQARIYDALQLMAEKDVGALLVMEGDRLVGIFSERDYARKLILHGKSSLDTLVREVMTPQVITVSPDENIFVCMELMTDRHIRHLPVIEEGRVIGLVSIGDVVKAIISEQQFVISQLESYITGRR